MADTVKQSKNTVRVVGTLVENSLKPGTYKDKSGVEKEYIAGTLTVRVAQAISGKEEIEEIPINVWVNKYTKVGKINPAYDSVHKAMETYVSLAATENEALATKILITNGFTSENLFSTDGEKVWSTPRVSSNFISTVGANAFVQEATFTHDMIVGKVEEEVNKEGLPTGRLKVKGFVIKYNGQADNYDYIVENKDAINYIRSYYQPGETVQVSGKIRFTSKTEHIEVPTRFGEPVMKDKTTTCKELIITADSTDILTPEEKFTEAEIQHGQELRLLEVEKAKTNAKERNKKVAPTSTAGADPYGF